MAITVVTGANRGIGLELVRQLAARGASVVAVCRTPSPELEALGVRVVSGIDVADGASISRCAEQLAGEHLDVLIHNAGVLRWDDLSTASADALVEQFRVNALGPVLLTQALAGSLVHGSKVALITSRMGSIADNTSGAMYGYRMSKAALNAAGVSLARDLASYGVAVVLLHPGHVRTEMTRNTGMVDPSESATGLLARIDELTLERSGEFRHMNGELLPW